MADYVAAAKKSYTLPSAEDGATLALFLLDENGDILLDENSTAFIDSFYSLGGATPKASAKVAHTVKA